MKLVNKILAVSIISIMAFGATQTMAAGERIVLISHAPDSDSWWNTIKNSFKLAGEQMGVETIYRNPTSGDLADMARIIQQATASNPDGIITTIPDYDVLKSAIEGAIKKGIPVITMNSGSHEQSKALGALMHIGQPEYAAGKGAGERAKKEAGIKSFLCVNHYITNPSSVERCQGFADGLGVPLGSQMIDSGQDPTDVENKILAYLRSHPDTDAILTLGPSSAHPALRALKKTKKAGKMYFGTFDLSEEIAQGIEDGVIAFAIDQQPFLQGYLPVVMLVNYSRYGVLPGNSINSGPGFITKDNVALVLELAGEYR